MGVEPPFVRRKSERRPARGGEDPGYGGSPGPGPPAIPAPDGVTFRAARASFEWRRRGGGTKGRDRVRAQDSQVTAVDNLLAAQADPENPGQPEVSQPSSALTAQADAAGPLPALKAARMSPAEALWSL